MRSFAAPLLLAIQISAIFPAVCDSRETDLSYAKEVELTRSKMLNDLRIDICSFLQILEQPPSNPEEIEKQTEELIKIGMKIQATNHAILAGESSRQNYNLSVDDKKKIMERNAYVSKVLSSFQVPLDLLLTVSTEQKFKKSSK